MRGNRRAGGKMGALPSSLSTWSNGGPHSGPKQAHRRLSGCCDGQERTIRDLGMSHRETQCVFGCQTLWPHGTAAACAPAGIALPTSAKGELGVPWLL